MGLTGFEKLKEVAGICARDLATFNALYVKTRESWQTHKTVNRTTLDDSMELLLFGSTLLTTLTHLRLSLNEMTYDTVFTGRASRVALQQEMIDAILNVRSALSATVERNRTLRDIWAREFIAPIAS